MKPPKGAGTSFYGCSAIAADAAAAAIAVALPCTPRWEVCARVMQSGCTKPMRNTGSRGGRDGICIGRECKIRSQWTIFLFFCRVQRFVCHQSHWSPSSVHGCGSLAHSPHSLLGRGSLAHSPHSLHPECGPLAHLSHMTRSMYAHKAILSHTTHLMHCQNTTTRVKTILKFLCRDSLKHAHARTSAKKRHDSQLFRAQ